MEPKQIVLEFHKDGTVKVSPSGFPGGRCRDATKFLEDALGKVVSTTSTPEAFLAEEDEQTSIKTS